MNKRELLLSLSCLALATTARAEAQGRMFRLAVISSFASRDDLADPVKRAKQPFYPAVFDELRRLGYYEGKNLLVEWLSTDGDTQRIPELIAAVIRSRPD